MQQKNTYYYLKKYVGKEMQKRVAKYILFIGQVVAASTALGIIYG